MTLSLACSGQTTVNLNDGVNTFVDMEGVDLGLRKTTWEEVPSYGTGIAVQVNVYRGNLVPVTIPMRVKDTSVASLVSRLNTLWATVEACNPVTYGTLTWDAESYTIHVSSRPDTLERNILFQLNFMAQFTLVLMRTPT